MFNGNMGYGFPTQQPQMMYNGIAPQQMPKRTNTLTEDEIKQLQQKQQFSLDITEREHLQAKCNHRLPDGSGDALVQDGDSNDPNAVVCKICGQRFTQIMTDSPEDYIKNITDEFVNLLQTIKIMFIDMPQDAANTFFDLIPLSQKVPELFKIACRNMAKYDSNGIQQYNGMSQGAMSLLGNFMNMAGSGQPFGYGYQQAQPMYQQPQQFNAYGNPFGYPNANQFGNQMGYQPGTTGFQYNPAQPNPTANPTTNGATPTADNTKTTTTNVQA